MDHAGGDQYSSKTVVCGVDVGSVLNVDICEVVVDEYTQKSRRIGIWTGEVVTFEAVYDMLSRYRVDIAGVDARPEARKAQELRDKAISSGVCDVWLCEFHKTERVGAQDFGITMDWNRHVVKVDRTQLLDTTLADLQTTPPLRTWPEDVWHIRHWQGQMEAPKRIQNVHGDGYLWDSSRAADHFRFSDAYSRVAVNLLKMQRAYHG